MLSYEVMVSMALSIKEEADAFVRNKPDNNPYFDAYKGLTLESSYTTTNAIVNALVYHLHKYLLVMTQVITRVVNIMTFEQMTGTDMAMRERLENKFSKIASYFTGNIQFPVNETIVQMILDNSAILAKSTTQKGHHLVFPYWLPVWDNNPSYAVDPGDLTNTLFADCPVRLPNIDELFVDTTPGVSYPADTSNSATGSLGKYLFAELDAAVLLMKSEFDKNSNEFRNITHANNLILKMAIENWGVLSNTMFKFRDFAAKLRNDLKVVDYDEYMASFPGYLGEFQPIPASPLNSGTARDCSLMSLPDTEAGADYITDVDTFYGSLTHDDDNSIMTASELDGNVRTRYMGLLLTDDQRDSFLQTGKLPTSDPTVIGGTSATYAYFNADVNEGALAASPDGIEDFAHTIGFKPKVTALLEMLGGTQVYEDEPGKLFEELKANSAYMAMSSEAVKRGIIMPFWLVTPVKDVYDPEFFGTRPLISSESANVPGTFSNEFKSAYQDVQTSDLGPNSSANEVVIGGSSADYPGSEDFFDPTSEGPLKYAKDIVGPFIGDAMNLELDEHFSRNDLIVYDMYPQSSSLGINVPFPCKPHVKDPLELSGFENPVIHDGDTSPLEGIDYDGETATITVADLVANDDVITLIDSQDLRAYRNIRSRFVSLIGRVKTRLVEAYHLLIANNLDVYSGNTINEFITKLGPAPAAKTVSVALSIQQFIDISTKPMGRESQSMKVFGERKAYSGRSTSENKSYGSKKPWKSRSRKSKGKFKKKSFDKSSDGFDSDSKTSSLDTPLKEKFGNTVDKVSDSDYRTDAKDAKTKSFGDKKRKKKDELDFDKLDD
jgi:hypothetical protein